MGHMQRGVEMNLPSILFLFNHTPTDIQLEDARLSLGIGAVRFFPEELRNVWSKVSPQLEGIDEWIEPIRGWVAENSTEGDYMLIQGDFGATYLMVLFAMQRGLIPVYSTTDREAVEELGPEGSVKLVHRFRHVRFRRYGI
jgi:hypothetical protein